ncbi:MAG TPA: HupE/UreJ family protein [Acetobacteraceae bacterium]|nr:HupE/UreJ family protein [Acetobacteraceae bacterium]
MIRPFALSIALFAPLPALAHHPLGGAMPQSAWQGLLSGLGHPLIGVDHLAFMVGAGLLSALLPRGAAVLAVTLFVAASAAGTILHLAGLSLGPVEAMVAGSALTAGVLVLRAGVLRQGFVGLGFALAGLVHGHAFAEAVLGAEPMPILAYLLGLAAVQAAMMLGLALLARDIGVIRRVAGAAVVLVGCISLAMALA